MIRAESFVEAARNYGFTRYAGVPCSFLTPFINYVINDEQLNYVSAANEGDAVAIAAGAGIGGERSVVMLQNSGLGNAVSPLTSLNYVFHIPALLIITHRGAPGLADEPQHALMGEITGELLDTMRIPWEQFPCEESEIDDVLQRATHYMQKEHRPYALIMSKGSVAPYDLNNEASASNARIQARQKDFFVQDQARPSRNQALKRILEHASGSKTILIATTGYSGRELFAIEDNVNQLYMVGSMGCASSLGLGLALARPDLQIVIIDGDGAALMRLGNFSTIGAYAPGNLIHVLLDNEVHDSTGAQATVSANVEFADIAAGCGYSLCYRGNELGLLDELFTTTNSSGARFGHLKTRPGTIEKLPRPDITPPQVVQRLMSHIGSSFE